MNGSSAPEQMLKRALKHERALSYGAATRVVENEFGSIVLNTDFPSALSHNVVFVDDIVSPEVLLSEVDRVLEGAGIAFRVIAICERKLVDALAPALQEAGFEQSSDLLMVLLDSPKRRPTIQANLTTFEEVRPNIEAAWRRGGISEKGARLLTNRATTYVECCELTYHTVRMEDSFVSRCTLYKRGTSAQIDEVMTDPPWEGRGYATAVISAAVCYAGEQGCNFIFLRTDASDWPQHLYRQLGFHDVGRTFWFERNDD